MESGCNVWCGEQEAGVASGSGWNLWVWLLGVGCKEVYRFPHIILCFQVRNFLK